MPKMMAKGDASLLAGVIQCAGRFSHMTRHKQIGIAIAMVAFVLCILGLVVTVATNQKSAQAFLHQAAAFELRVTSQEQVELLAANYGGRLEPETCTPTGCSYFFRFDNRWLHRLHLAPYTQLTCTLGLSHGVLIYRRVLLTSGNKGSYGAFVEEWIDYPEGVKKIPDLAYPIDIRRQFVGLPGAAARWRVTVTLTADASPEQHHIAYDLNTWCLSRVGGCEDARQLLPSVSWNSQKAASPGSSSSNY